MKNFFRPVSDTIMQSYPGATFAVDIRQSAPKPYYEYWVALLPQAKIKHVCHLPSKNLSIPIPHPDDTLDFVRQQETYETKDAIDLGTLGSTTRAPLGHVVHARSGDKGSDCNVGFFVRNQDEWDWLRSLLTVDKIREMMGDDDTGKPIFRFELPHISGTWSAVRMRKIIRTNSTLCAAVHFLLKDHLDRGVASSSTYDVLGKNMAEYLRCKRVDVPDKFLDRGRI